MPEVKSRTSFIINLFNRCKQFRCLPYPGSLLEQPSWIMDLFDSIESAINGWKRNKQEEAERHEVMRQQEQELRKRIGK